MTDLTETSKFVPKTDS